MPSLPFLSTGTVTDQQGTELGQVVCSVWATGNVRVGPQGVFADHEGEAALSGASLLDGGANRTLTVDGVSYKIVQALRQPHVPHVELLLRRTQSA